MKRLVTVLLLGIMLVTPSCDFVKKNNPFGRKAREAEALRQQQEAFRIADSIKVAEEEAARQLDLLTEQARVAEQEASRQSDYHIIVGSFLTPEYAASWLDHMTQMGHSARIINMGGGRWQLVSVNSYPTLNDAWNALQKYQNDVNQDAWIYKPD